MRTGEINGYSLVVTHFNPSHLGLKRQGISLRAAQSTSEFRNSQEDYTEKLCLEKNAWHGTYIQAKPSYTLIKNKGKGGAQAGVNSPSFSLLSTDSMGLERWRTQVHYRRGKKGPKDSGWWWVLQGISGLQGESPLRCRTHQRVMSVNLHFPVSSSLLKHLGKR